MLILCFLVYRETHTQYTTHYSHMHVYTVYDIHCHRSLSAYVTTLAILTDVPIIAKDLKHFTQSFQPSRVRISLYTIHQSHLRSHYSPRCLYACVTCPLCKQCGFNALYDFDLRIFAYIFYGLSWIRAGQVRKKRQGTLL